MNLSTHVALIGPDKYSRVELDIPKLDDDEEAPLAKDVLFKLDAFANIEPFDAALAALQDPDARFLRTRDQWADVGGWPKLGTTPVMLTGPEGEVELYYSDKEIQPIAELKTLSEFKAGKNVGVRGSRQLLADMHHGALGLTSEVVVSDDAQPVGDVTFPGGAVRAVDPYIPEIRDELAAPEHDRPAVFQVLLSRELNRRQSIEVAIRGLATVVLAYPNPWRALSPADSSRVDQLIDDVFAGRSVYWQAAATGWSVMRDMPRTPEADEATQFEIDLVVWSTKKRFSVRLGQSDRDIEVFVSNRKAVAPRGVSFPRVLRAQTFVERALLNRPINPALYFPQGSGRHILSMLGPEGAGN